MAHVVAAIEEQPQQRRRFAEPVPMFRGRCSCGWVGGWRWSKAVARFECVEHLPQFR